MLTLLHVALSAASRRASTERVDEMLNQLAAVVLESDGGGTEESMLGAAIKEGAIIKRKVGRFEARTAKLTATHLEYFRQSGTPVVNPFTEQITSTQSWLNEHKPDAAVRDAVTDYYVHTRPHDADKFTLVESEYARVEGLRETCRKNPDCVEQSFLRMICFGPEGQIIRSNGYTLPPNDGYQNDDGTWHIPKLEAASNTNVLTKSFLAYALDPLYEKDGSAIKAPGDKNGVMKLENGRYVRGDHDSDYARKMIMNIGPHEFVAAVHDWKSNWESRTNDEKMDQYKAVYTVFGLGGSDWMNPDPYEFYPQNLEGKDTKANKERHNKITAEEGAEPELITADMFDADVAYVLDAQSGSGAQTMQGQWWQGIRERWMNKRDALEALEKEIASYTAYLERATRYSAEWEASETAGMDKAYSVPLKDAKVTLGKRASMLLHLGSKGESANEIVVEDTPGHTLVFMGATTEETADWKEKLDAAIAKL